MKKNPITVITLTALTMAVLIGNAAAGNPHGATDKPDSMSQGMGSHHEHSAVQSSQMYQDSEHVLAAAYLTNLHTFAITLRTQASHASALEPEFARTAVAEMRRSFDEMQSHHQLLMKSMSDEESAKMVATMKQMHADHATIQDHLAVLEAEVEKDALDSKAILQHTSTILKSCKAMTGMQTAAVRQ